MKPPARACSWIVSVASALAMHTAAADSSRLDAGMRRHLDAQSLRHTRGSPADAADAASHATLHATLHATVHFTGDGLDELRAHGVAILSVMGDTATIRIPPSRLGEIAALPGIIRVEKPRKPVRRLDQSVVAIKADQLRTGTGPAGWTGGTGKGVIIGIIDSGLDLRHMDFRKPDGTSRVVAFWNQRSDAAGTPPQGADGTPLYGAVCSQTAIDLALSGSASNCLVADTGAHGTHVAGISAGNGQATGKGQARNRFIGLAPEADLMVANAIDSGVTQDNAVLDAVAFMVSQARSLGLPIVINLSLGSYFGSRDGTSAYERALDNASGPGAILVGAAGNEADVKLRAVGTLAQGQSVSVGFSVPAGAVSEQLEMWYPGANQVDVMLSCGGFSTPAIAAGDSSYAQDTPCGRISISSTAPGPGNGDRQILATLERGASRLMAGAWTLTLKGSVVGPDHRFSIISGETVRNSRFTTHTEAVTSEILTDTASATRVVSVAAFNTRAQWNSASGAYDATAAGTMTGTLGDISNFSSRGPRRMCSDAGKCPPVMKPEITAPGSYVVSSYTSIPARPEPATDVEADGVHVALYGTSMATAHVTGTVALLLQAKPDLTPEEAKRILAQTAQANSFSAASGLPKYTGEPLPPAPNYAWGYGIVDSASAFRSLIGASLAVPGWHLLGNTLNTQIDVASAFAGSTSVTSIWKWDARTSRWEFYSPSLDPAGLAAYTAGKGYAELSTIQPGDGFWVDLKSAATLPLRGGQVVSLDTGSLAAGWNLLATGLETTPAAINASRPVTSVWAWDHPAQKWYFYAPSLAAGGGTALGDYIGSKGYLDFIASGKKLGHGVGFWVNR